jgi:subtilisin family serine protease
VDVAWAGGTTVQASGNSFATPHVAGMAARILSKHPGLTPFQLKAVLHAVADNAD